MDRNGRGDRYKSAGYTKISYDNGEYIYHFDTFPGDSGSPLFDESGSVRAIHYGGSGRGNIAIAFIPIQFPNLKEYLAEPWGKIHDFAEPRQEPNAEAKSLIMNDCCDKQRQRHQEKCGCIVGQKCRFVDPCPDHSAFKAPVLSELAPTLPKVNTPAVAVILPPAGKPDIQPIEQPEAGIEKGKAPAVPPKPREDTYEIQIRNLQKGQVRVESMLEDIARALNSRDEEAAAPRVQTRTVKNVKKGYKKGPTKDPVEESASSKPKAEPCAYCKHPAHSAQQCRKLKARVHDQEDDIPKQESRTPKTRLER
jgi:hypothetical protein